MKAKETCPDCGRELGTMDNNECCDTEIVKRIIEERLTELEQQGKEPAVSKEWVIERIVERCHPTRFLKKTLEDSD